MEEYEVFNHVLRKYNGHDQEVVIPRDITSLGDFAFTNCVELKKVILHDEIDEIGDYCFYNCDSLEDIIIPDSVRFIGSGAFSSCRSLETITLPKYLRTINKSMFHLSEKLHTVNLGENIISIDHDAFSCCRKLKNFKFPVRLKSIGDSAFEECESILKIQLPDTLTTLGKKVFFHCLNLHSITLPASLKEVGEGAFQTHSYLSIDAPDSLFLKPMMFDCNYMFDWDYSFKMKNGDNYNLHHSYLPALNLENWKPAARIILLTNFLETYDHYQIKEQYKKWCAQYKENLLSFLILQKRFDGLNKGIEENIISTNEITPYLDQIDDREEKAKLLEYTKNASKTNLNGLDDLLDDLF